MRQWKWVVPVLALGMSACGNKASPSQDEETGTLSLALVGTARDGTQYRLRNGQFEMYGYPEYYQQGASEPGAAGSGWIGGEFFDTLSTETDPDATVITKRLVPGWYYLTLLQGWHIEELTPTGPVPVEQSVLLSPSTQFAYVYHTSTTDVAYRFGVGGEPIDFRSGEVRIRVEIELPGEGPGQGGASGFGGWPSAGASMVPTAGTGGAF